MQTAVRTAIPPIILAAGIAGYFLLAGQRAVETQPAPTDAAPLVEVTEVVSHGGGLDIRSDGVVVPYREITMAAEVAGRVTKKAAAARAGNYVA